MTRFANDAQWLALLGRRDDPRPAARALCKHLGFNISHARRRPRILDLFPCNGEASLLELRRLVLDVKGENESSSVGLAEGRKSEAMLGSWIAELETTEPLLVPLKRRGSLKSTVKSVQSAGVARRGGRRRAAAGTRACAARRMRSPRARQASRRRRAAGAWREEAAWL